MKRPARGDSYESSVVEKHAILLSFHPPALRQLAENSTNENRTCNACGTNLTRQFRASFPAAGRPNREVFKAGLPDFKDRYLNGETGTHYDWFVKLYATPATPA